MSLTDKGFELKRFSQLILEVDEAIQSSFGGGVDLSSDAVIGVLESIVVKGQADVWELAQGVYDSTNLLAADGNMLDNLALLVGFVRLPASRSKGSVWITAKDGTDITKDTVLMSIANEEFFVVNNSIVSSTDCQNSRLYVKVVDDNSFSYNVNVNGNLFSYVSTLGDTENDILVGLNTEFQALGDLNTNLVLDTEDQSNSYIYIEKVDTSSNLLMSAVTYLSFDYVTTPVFCRSVEYGEIKASANTITSFKATNPNIYSLTNPLDFDQGSNLESDNSLRNRVIEAYTKVSAGTPNTIWRKISEITGVIDVKIKSNTTMSTDVEGIPPKAYKVIVYGGTDKDVGEAIWESKPAGVQPWSDPLGERTSIVEIEDYNSQSHTVLFTRPDVKYAWVKVDYTKYLEESFTGGGEEIMKASVVDTGKKLSIGEDIIPKRFYGPLYKSVDGIQDLSISVALSDDINTPPLAGEYVDVRVPITDEQITDFSEARVFVTLI